jgi:hypothetical protein
MGRSTKESWLQGPGDLKEAEVEDVPVPGESVRVRGLPAQYSNEAASEALEMKTIIKRGREEQIATVNTATMEVLQFAHGCLEPSFSPEEAKVIATKYGPAFKKVIAAIDDLSGVDKEAIEEAQARFPVGGAVENGQGEVAQSDPEPAVSARAGA